MASKKSLEERIKEKDERMQKAFEKAKQYEAQKKQLEQRQKEADRKARNHRLIQIGAAAESILGRTFEEGDLERFLNFLRLQEKNGSFFTKAMQKPFVSNVSSKAAVAAKVIPTEKAISREVLEKEGRMESIEKAEANTVGQEE